MRLRWWKTKMSDKNAAPEPTKRDDALDHVHDWVSSTEDRLNVLETEVELAIQRKKHDKGKKK